MKINKSDASRDASRDASLSSALLLEILVGRLRKSLSGKGSHSKALRFVHCRTDANECDRSIVQMKPKRWAKTGGTECGHNGFHAPKY